MKNNNNNNNNKEKKIGKKVCVNIKQRSLL